MQEQGHIAGEGPALPPLAPRAPQHLSGARLIEGVLIAVVAGAIAATFGSHMTTVRLEERLSRMQDEQLKLSRQVEEIRRDIYRPRWDSQQMVRTPYVTEGGR